MKQSLNDQREMVHARDDAVALLESLAEDVDYHRWARALIAVAKELEDADSLPATYVTCFCEEPDLLSQWRGYGGNTQGIALEFNRVELRTYFGGARLARVIYTGDDTSDVIAQLWDDESFFLYDGDDGSAGMSRIQRESAIREEVGRLLPRFKHKGFEEEREWRFILQAGRVPDDVMFRVKNSHIVPYVALKRRPKARRLPLKRVVIGPGANFEITERSVRLFLQKSGYDKVEIVRSATPYRT